jgi:Beta-propeller repeat
MIDLARRAAAAALISAGLTLAACGSSSVPLATVSQQPGSVVRASKAQRCAAKPCIYVANNSPDGVQTVTIYAQEANGDVAPVDTIHGKKTGLSSPSAVAVDPSRNLYVSNFLGGASGNGDVTVYASGSYGNVAPSQTIESEPSYDLMRNPSGVALDSGGDIYVSGWGSDSISVYAPGADGDPAPIQYIAGDDTGLDSPSYVAVSKNRTIYVSNFYGNSLTVYAPGANGNVAPVQTIAGAETNLYHCTAVALNSKGEIYVTNVKLGPSGSPGVAIFGKGANGNVAPIRTISGPKTGLNQPNGITFDSDGNIYVTNAPEMASGNDSVTVYARGANGDVAPIRTITGKKTLLNIPSGLVVR